MTLFFVDSFEYIVFKERNHNWLLFDQFLSDFNDSCAIWTRILRNLNLSSKSEFDNCNSNSDNFSELDCVYTTTFSFGGEMWYYNRQLVQSKLFFFLQMLSFFLGPI
jgi:hypothetical protein